MLILWDERAEADVDEIFSFILERNPSAAWRMRDAVISQVALLANQPWLGRTGRVAETRELVIARTPFVVAYAVDQPADAVIILRVLHGARRWPAEL